MIVTDLQLSSHVTHKRSGHSLTSSLKLSAHATKLRLRRKTGSLAELEGLSSTAGLNRDAEDLLTELQKLPSQNNALCSNSNDGDSVDEHFMGMAFREAMMAGQCGEVPIGAVIVYQGEVISRGQNSMERTGNPLRHAELEAIEKAVASVGRFVLPQSTMYVTSEPCPMCAGALLQARIGRIVYGARSPLIGAEGSWVQLLRVQQEGSISCFGAPPASRPHAFHPNIQVRSGVMAEECAALLRLFFRQRRKQGSRQPKP